MQMIYEISMLFLTRIDKSSDLLISDCGFVDVTGSLRKPSKQRSNRLQTKGQPGTHEKPPLHQMTERMSV